PFSNTLNIMHISGAEAMSMVEDGLHAVFGPGGTSGPYPYTAGLRFDVDAGRPRGRRAGNFQVQDPATGQWRPLDVQRMYRLVTPAFNAQGGDGYETLARVPQNRNLDVGILDADTLLAYIDGRPRDTATG